MGPVHFSDKNQERITKHTEIKSVYFYTDLRGLSELEYVLIGYYP